MLGRKKRNTNKTDTKGIIKAQIDSKQPKLYLRLQTITRKVIIQTFVLISKV